MKALQRRFFSFGKGYVGGVKEQVAVKVAKRYGIGENSFGIPCKLIGNVVNAEACFRDIPAGFKVAEFKKTFVVRVKLLGSCGYLVFILSFISFVTSAVFSPNRSSRVHTEPSATEYVTDSR